MPTKQGFSLVEVLVSLLLLTSTSLALLKQQWRVHQVCNQQNSQMHLSIQLENDAERARVEDSNAAQSSKHHQQGMGLSELLLSLLLASMIMLVLMHHYISVKQQYLSLQTELEHHLDLNLVIDLVRDGSRKAGFTPCLSIDRLNTVDMRAVPHRLTAIEIGSEELPWLRLNRMSERFNTVLQITSNTELLIANTEPIHRDQSIVIADCYHAEVHKVQEVIQMSSQQKVRLSKPFAFQYESPVYLGEWIEDAFFIRASHQGKGALFYRRNHSDALTSAIHNFAAELSHNLSKATLKITLELEEGRHLELLTMIRSQ